MICVGELLLVMVLVNSLYYGNSLYNTLLFFIELTLFLISIGLTQCAMNCVTTNHACFEKHGYFQEIVFVIRKRFIACLRKSCSILRFLI